MKEFIPISIEEREQIKNNFNNWTLEADLICRKAREKLAEAHESYSHQMCQIMSSDKQGEKYHYVIGIDGFKPIDNINQIYDVYDRIIRHSEGHYTLYLPYFKNCEFHDYNGSQIKWEHYEEYKNGKFHRKINRVLEGIKSRVDKELTRYEVECAQKFDDYMRTAMDLSHKVEEMLEDCKKIIKEVGPAEKIVQYLEMIEPTVRKHPEFTRDFSLANQCFSNGIRLAPTYVKIMKEIMEHGYDDKCRTPEDRDRFIEIIEHSRKFSSALTKVYNNLHNSYSELPSLEEFMKSPFKYKIGKGKVGDNQLITYEQLARLQNENVSLKEELAFMKQKNKQFKKDEKALKTEIQTLREDFEKFKVHVGKFHIQLKNHIIKQADETHDEGAMSELFHASPPADKNEYSASLFGHASDEIHSDQYN